MKSQLFLVALSSVLALCQGQGDNALNGLVTYLNQLGAGDEGFQTYLARILAPQNIDNVVECLLSDGQRQGCDPRSTAVGRAIPLLIGSNLQCRSCSPAVQQTINAFSEAILSNPTACQKLISGLQIDPSRFCRG